MLRQDLSWRQTGLDKLRCSRSKLCPVYYELRKSAQSNVSRLWNLFRGSYHFWEAVLWKGTHSSSATIKRLSGGHSWGELLLLFLDGIRFEQRRSSSQRWEASIPWECNVDERWLSNQNSMYTQDAKRIDKQRLIRGVWRIDDKGSAGHPDPLLTSHTSASPSILFPKPVELFSFTECNTLRKQSDWPKNSFLVFYSTSLIKAIICPVLSIIVWQNTLAAHHYCRTPLRV